MGKLAFERKLKVFFLTALANIAAPTVAELGAGTDITQWIPTDGFSPSRANNKASTSMLDKAHTAQNAGTFSDDLSITFMRDDVDEEAWNLFDYGTTGWIVAAPFGDPVATDRVEVYPVESFKPAPAPSAENTHQKFSVEFSVTDEPELNAIVAAA